MRGSRPGVGFETATTRPEASGHYFFQLLLLPMFPRIPSPPVPALARRQFPTPPLMAALLGLSLLAACQSPDTPVVQAAQAAPASMAPAPSAPAAEGAASYTLTIDGQPEALTEVLLSRAPNQGFVFGFTSAQATVEIIGSAKAPLVVGTYPVLDIAGTAVSITAELPPRYAPERKADDPTGYFSMLGLKKGEPVAQVHDWGKGIQELQGRQLGQVVFTRVSPTTADGSFKSYVYSKSFSQTEYQGQPRVLVRHKGHLLEGTFKNLPYGDVGKSLGDLQKALKATEGLR